MQIIQSINWHGVQEFRYNNISSKLMIIIMSSKLFLLFENIALFSVIFFQLKPTIADSDNIIIRCIDEEREALLTFKAP